MSTRLAAVATAGWYGSAAIASSNARFGSAMSSFNAFFLARSLAIRADTARTVGIT